MYIRSKEVRKSKKNKTTKNELGHNDHLVSADRIIHIKIFN